MVELLSFWPPCAAGWDEGSSAAGRAGLGQRGAEGWRGWHVGSTRARAVWQMLLQPWCWGGWRENTSRVDQTMRVKGGKGEWGDAGIGAR